MNVEPLNSGIITSAEIANNVVQASQGIAEVTENVKIFVTNLRKYI